MKFPATSDPCLCKINLSLLAFNNTFREMWLGGVVNVGTLGYFLNGTLERAVEGILIPVAAVSDVPEPESP